MQNDVLTAVASNAGGKMNRDAKAIFIRFRIREEYASKREVHLEIQKRVWRKARGIWKMVLHGIMNLIFCVWADVRKRGAVNQTPT